MLISSSSYLSNTFWSAAGVVVALVGVVVTVLLSRLGSPRRLLFYSLDSDTPLLNSEDRARAAGAELRILLRGQELSDPHFVSFQIVSRSRRDVRPGDFTGSRPLVFDLAAPILKMLASDTGGDKMPDVAVVIDASKVLVGPSLINRKQRITLDLLTDGPVKLTCPRPPLADVTIREWGDEFENPPALKRIIYGGLIIAFAGLVINTIGRNSHIAWLIDIGIGVFVTALLGVPLVGSVWGTIIMVRA